MRRVLVLCCALLVVIGPAPAQADAPEQIVNGTFDNGHAPWWGTGNITLDSSTQKLCADIPAGTVNPWDVIVGQDNIALIAGESYEFSFEAPNTAVGKAIIQLPMDPWTQYVLINMTSESSGSFTSPVDLPNAQLVFQIGGASAAWRFCIDNISLKGGAEPPVYVPDTGPRVRVNQVGYQMNGVKNATLVTESTAAMPWQLVGPGGAIVESGQTTPRGVDATSGQNVHAIAFRHATAGTYQLVADGETSHPFTIGEDFYGRMRDDSLKFYYTQRSGIEIRGDLRPGYARPAGHLGVAPNTGDTAVPCQPGVCDYTLDVRGGWYDAGDHGKYVVNGGISVHQLMSAFERNRFAFGDGQLSIPESGNGVPDILDEARWQMEFMLSMQVPAGKPLAGMAHHKIHDNNWTGLPLLPHVDPMLRELHPPSTAATLNLAATAAQCARLFAPYDRAFARKCLSVAEKAWAAAVANPARYATPADGNGGGPYDDDDVTDEFYWAAAELFITTGKHAYKSAVLASPHHTGNIFRPQGFDWKWTAPLGRLQLASVPNGLRMDTKPIVEAANRYLAAQEANPYHLTYTPSGGMFDWGSNNLVLNNLVVMAVASDLTRDPKFADGVRRGMDYLLGRNALNKSYVTGYGESFSKNQHSRWYAKQLNGDLPNPPNGTLAGGPNSSIQDPVAQQKLTGCAGQFCYIDDIESWSTNELTINWNSPLAWVSSFLASHKATGDCRVRYVKQAQWHNGFLAQVTIENTGSKAIDGWQLRWSFLSGQTAGVDYGASLDQSGAMVTASAERWNGRIGPGRSVTFGFLGDPYTGPNPSPNSFTLNGTPCR